MKKISFPARGEFNKTLKKRVEQYFAEHNLAKTGNWQMFLKTALVLAWLVVSYLLLVFFSASLVMAIITALAVAQGFVLVGFNIMHDGNHDSYSKNKKINWLMGFTLDLIGGSNMFWQQKHNILHHTYTNIDGVDDDLFTGGLLRLSPEQKKHSWHRFQHLYALPAYSLLTLSWITFLDNVQRF
jgi:linoleoyl-CoA desaturase